jgi:hypothetical protein
MVTEVHIKFFGEKQIHLLVKQSLFSITQRGRVMNGQSGRSGKEAIIRRNPIHGGNCHHLV